ncbi:Ethanolamine utilization protein EutQ [Caloramator mitchellensis]|uniref:Ethanolamine utilization protein EutQ n=1 Tax=Caloramator mitchellensis TaxID=908809 RepID=A0A0R3K0Q5_CALMK|nr:cupin domain-containing protein [Caloramator mitchellensis]KRQ86501.1 Ethanolamine utilization protein EutQ [Caloramator mitchellensis]
MFDEKCLKELIKQIVIEQMNLERNNFVKNVDKSGIMSVKSETVKCEPFDTGKKGDKVFLKDVFTLEESPRIGCGVMEMYSSSFDWTLCYDEIDVILEGTLEIVIDGRSIVGKKGDILFIPMGSQITFSCPDYARFIYITYPADWQNTK